MLEPVDDQSASLLQRWQDQGDRAALDELLAIEIQMLKARLRRQGASVHPPSVSVSDVAQDVAMRILQVDPAPQFQNPRAMRGYLWTAAQRLLIEHLRRRSSAHLPLDASQSGGLEAALQTTGGLHGVEDRDFASALSVVLQLLDPDDQQVLELHYFREVDAAGIAATLGISPEAARMRVVRARDSLAKKMVKWTGYIS